MEKRAGFLRENRCYILAALTCAGAVWLLWFLQERVYGGIETGYWRWIFYPSAGFAGAYLGGHLQEGGQEETTAPAETRSAWRQQLLCAPIHLLGMLFILFMVWKFLGDSPYTPYSYQLLSLFAGAGLLRWFPQAETRLKQGGRRKAVARIAALLFALGAVATLLYFAVTQPVTISQGRRLVEEAGYSNVRFVGGMGRGELSHHLYPAEKEGVESYDFSMPHTVYYGEKEGQSWSVALRLYRNDIPGTAHLTEEERQFLLEWDG